MISKAYILHIDTELSQQYAKDTLTSCFAFGVNAELFCGFNGMTFEDAAIKLGVPIVDNMKPNELACTMGHIALWEKIAAGTDPVAIFEHDVIVKHSLDEVEVNDDEIVFLGPRVDHRDDYTYPEWVSLERFFVHRFEGAHAYALTPSTARRLLSFIQEINILISTVDGMIGLKNLTGSTLIAMDPPLVVAEIGNRPSTTQDTPCFWNQEVFPGQATGYHDRTKILNTPVYHFTQDWFTRNIPFWERVFLRVGLDRNGPIRVLEIGSFEGRSASWMMNNILHHADSKLYCVDPFEGSEDILDAGDYHDRFIWNMTISNNFRKLVPMEMRSDVALPILIEQGQEFDFIYVDGSHKFEDVVLDGEMSYKLLKKGGLLIFDDFEWEFQGDMAVKRACFHLEQNLPIRVVDTEWQRAYIKV